MQTTIHQAYVAGKWEWPELERPTLEEFAARVGQLGTSDADLERHCSDLYLASACGAGCQQAMRVFEQRYREELDAHLDWAGFDTASREDALQQLALHLFTGGSPRINTYAGKASLSTWLKVATLRFAINMKPKLQTVGAEFAELELARFVADDGNPELSLVSEDARALCQRALARAMSSLSERDTTILRLFFVEGLSNEGIGRLYGVHRATSARWIVDIRRRILEGVQSTLVNEFGLRDSEFESLARFVRSELSVSLERLSVGRGGTPEPGEHREGRDET